MSGGPLARTTRSPRGSGDRPLVGRASSRSARQIQRPRRCRAIAMHEKMVAFLLRLGERRGGFGHPLSILVEPPIGDLRFAASQSPQTGAAGIISQPRRGAFRRPAPRQARIEKSQATSPREAFAQFGVCSECWEESHDRPREGEQQISWEGFHRHQGQSHFFSALRFSRRSRPRRQKTATVPDYSHRAD